MMEFSYRPTNRVSEHFMAVKRAPRQQKSPVCKGNVEWLMKQQGITFDAISAEYRSRTGKDDIRGLKQILADGHAVVSNSLRVVAEILDVNPASLLKEDFQATHQVKHPSQQTLADPDEQIATQILRKLCGEGNARLARRVLEALAENSVSGTTT